MKIKILTFLLALFISNEVFAGSCTRPPVHEQYKNADIVFRGIVKNDPLGAKKCGSKTAIFEVKEVYKGKFTDEVSVFTDDSCSMTGSAFKKDKEYTVFAYSDGNYFEPNSNESIKFLISHACSGTHQIDPRHYQYFEDPHPFMAKLNNQMKSYDLLLTQADFSGEDLLKIKSQHYLYWEDYDNAVSILEELYNKNSSNEWVLENLILSLYKMNQPEKIWDIYLNDEALHKKVNEGGLFTWSYLPYVHYASFVLNKEFEKKPMTWPLDFPNREKMPNYSQIKPSLKDFKIFKLSLNQTDVNFHTIKNGIFSQVNFSNSNMSGDRIVDAKFFKSDFTNTKFNDIKFKNIEIYNSKLEGADFSNVQIENLSLERSTYDDTTKWPESFDPEKAGAYIAVTKTFLDPVYVE